MKKIAITLITVCILISSTSVSVNAASASDHTYYSQFGWNSSGDSMCYCACIAMTLTDLGIKTTPLDIYKFNGNTAFCTSFSSIASNFGATYHDIRLEAFSEEEKEKKVIDLLQQCPQGVIVYGGGHMVLARKVVNNTVYFDDPAYKDSWQSGGCCISISKINHTKWSNITYAGYFTKGVESGSTGTSNSSIANSGPSIESSVTGNWIVTVPANYKLWCYSSSTA